MSRDFSQSNEQAMILEWADRRQSHGRWLDIGAADGEAASNVRALALRGWGGVAVEPACGYFRHLANLYADRPDVEVVQAAVVTEPSPLVRFHLSDDLVSTTDEAHVETWGEIASFVPVYVGAVTVAQLLAALPGPYDMISVDTEGSSLPLARQLLDAGALAPGGLLCVECEDGRERWTGQNLGHSGFHRLGVTPNNLLMTNGPA